MLNWVTAKSYHFGSNIEEINCRHKVRLASLISWLHLNKYAFKTRVNGNLQMGIRNTKKDDMDIHHPNDEGKSSWWWATNVTRVMGTRVPISNAQVWRSMKFSTCPDEHQWHLSLLPFRTKKKRAVV